MSQVITYMDQIQGIHDPGISLTIAGAPRVAAEVAAQNEQMWLGLAQLAESMHDLDRAYQYYKNVLRHNPESAVALTCLGSLARSKNNHHEAIQYFIRLTRIDPHNGEVWGALGHCFLQLDNLPEAYHAYQQALFHLKEPKNPSLWYGIGVLYDRYGSWHHAQEAFTSVLQMKPNFEKASEIYYRLGLLYNIQGQFTEALDCFERTLASPPELFSRTDVIYQIALIRILQREFGVAQQLLEQILRQDPGHVLSLQELAWLFYCGVATLSKEIAAEYLNSSDLSVPKVDVAISLLKNVHESNRSDTLTAYLLGRCYVEKRAFTTAFEMFESCIRLNSANAYFWISIGVLYHLIYQFRDALDAYTRAIRQNPNLVEAWYNLGSLYEASNNQIRDAAEAYEKCLALDPQRRGIAERYENIVKLLRLEESGGPKGNEHSQLGPPPAPIQPQPLALSTFMQTMTSMNAPRPVQPLQQPQIVRTYQMSPPTAIMSQAPGMIVPSGVPQQEIVYGSVVPGHPSQLHAGEMPQAMAGRGAALNGARKRGRPSLSAQKPGESERTRDSEDVLASTAALEGDHSTTKRSKQ